MKMSQGEADESLTSLEDLLTSVSKRAPAFNIPLPKIQLFKEKNKDFNAPDYEKNLKILLFSELEQYFQNLVVSTEATELLKKRITDSFQEKFAIFKQNRMKLNEAEVLLKEYGAQKDLKVTHPSHAGIKEKTHQISRLVMRNLNPAIRNELNKVHQMFKDEFATLTDDEIHWLLGGAPSARGGFKDSTSFREFLNKPPDELSSSRLITAIDTISTAIGYRAIGASWATPPCFPTATDAAYNLYQKMKNKFHAKIVPFIGEKTYTTRDLDMYSSPKKPNISASYIGVEPDNISEASSVAYVEEKLPLQTLTGKDFRIAIGSESDGYTWPAAAFYGNIPIRAHVSGSAPIALSVISTLYEDRGDAWFQHEDNVKTFSGAVIIPSYERGDFHSVVETAAALEYFLDCRKQQVPKTRSPKTCLQTGLDCMVSAVSESFKSAISIITTDMMSMTTSEQYIAHISPEAMIGIFGHCKDPLLLQRIAQPKFIFQQDIDTLFDWIGVCKDTSIQQSMIYIVLVKIQSSALDRATKERYVNKLIFFTKDFDALYSLMTICDDASLLEIIILHSISNIKNSKESDNEKLNKLFSLYEAVQRDGALYEKVKKMSNRQILNKERDGEIYLIRSAAKAEKFFNLLHNKLKLLVQMY